MSEPLSPAAMAAVAMTPRVVSPNVGSPRAVSHFGLAAMEARAARSRAAIQPPPRPVALGPFPKMPPNSTAPSSTPSAGNPVRDIPGGPAAPAAPARRVRVRLWLPLTALFLLLSPFAVLLAPLIWLCTPPRYRTAPLATVVGLGRVLLSLGGTVVHVDTAEALVVIRIF